MAKAISLYSGANSYGRSIEVALRADGAWFSREYGWNRYGMGWSKWAKMEEAPTHPERIRNTSEYVDAEEFIAIPDEERKNRIEWGFSVFRLVPGPYRLRLPE